MTRKEAAKVTREIYTYFHGRFAGKDRAVVFVDDYGSRFDIIGFDDYSFVENWRIGLT